MLKCVAFNFSSTFSSFLIFYLIDCFGVVYMGFFVESLIIYEPNKDANEKKSKSRKNLVKVQNSNDMATIIEEDM